MHLARRLQLIYTRWIFTPTPDSRVLNTTTSGGSCHASLASSQMSKVTVYTFAATDRETGQNVADARMGTPEAIRRVKGMADLESKRLVNDSEVDAEGFYPAQPPCDSVHSL